jgi:hypothetical protein
MFANAGLLDSGKKKHLTAEEQALRRSEVARRRKNQSIQRAEKDKVRFGYCEKRVCVCFNLYFRFRLIQSIDCSKSKLLKANVL